MSGTYTMRFLRTLLVFVTVAVAGMALLPEALAYVNVGKDPATAYAPLQTLNVKPFGVVTPQCTCEPASTDVTLLTATAAGPLPTASQ